MLRFERKLPGQDWAPLGELGAGERPGSLSHYPRRGNREVIVFFCRNSRGIISRSAAGVDVEAGGRRDVWTGGLTELASLAPGESFTKTITTSGGGTVDVRWTMTALPWQRGHLRGNLRRTAGTGPAVRGRDHLVHAERPVEPLVTREQVLETGCAYCGAAAGAECDTAFPRPALFAGMCLAGMSGVHMRRYQDRAHDPPLMLFILTTENCGVLIPGWLLLAARRAGRVRRMPAPPLPADPADREATVRSEILDTISAHGGEVIVAGPPMEALVGELTAKVLSWLAAN